MDNMFEWVPELALAFLFCRQTQVSFRTYLAMLGVVLGIDLAMFAFTWSRVYPPNDHLFLNDVSPNTTRLLFGGASSSSVAALSEFELVRIIDLVDLVGLSLILRSE